jgi:hypothetical protein
MVGGATTVKDAMELVAPPKRLVTTTVYEPASLIWTLAIVKYVVVAPEIVAPEGCPPSARVAPFLSH